MGTPMLQFPEMAEKPVNVRVLTGHHQEGSRSPVRNTWVGSGTARRGMATESSMGVRACWQWWSPPSIQLNRRR